MQIKSFSARTSKEVLARIKDELGPDAVILDTQEEDGLITMTAALERASAAAPAPGPAGISSGFEPVGGRVSRFHIPQQAPSAPLFPPPADEDGIGGNPFAATYSPRGRLRPQPTEEPGTGSEAESVREMARRATEAAFAAPDGQPAPATRRAPGNEDARQTGQPGRQATRQTGGNFSGQTNGQAFGQPAGHCAPPREMQTGPYGSPPPGWQSWHEEWNSIKNHLLALMKPALRLDLLPPRQRLAIEFLQREGVEDAAVLHLFQRLQADPTTSILGPLGQLVPVRIWGLETWPQRLQMIAGPFGAGKTSVAVRMALALRRAAPACRICMINADATRGNGRLLLRHYCDLSDMAYKEASSTLELVASMNEALRENYERVIVDLPGFSRGRHLATLIADAGLTDRCGESPDDLAVHLALPPHYGTLQLRGVLERYRAPHAGSLIWTKLDEAEHYGQIVNVAVSTGLPVSALSFGPGLGNSLAPAKENMLWRLLFKRELPTGL